MLLLIKNPRIEYKFGNEPSRSCLLLDGTPVNTLHLSNGEILQSPIKITITPGPRESPYEIGSIFLNEKDEDDPAYADLWVHASREDIEAIYTRCKDAKYAYMSFLDHTFAIHDDDWSAEWNLDRGNPAAIESFSVHAADYPYLSDHDEPAQPPVQAPAPVVVVAPESKYIQLLFWAVVFLAIVLLLKVH